MSIKSFVQIVILTLMIFIIFGVYYKYFQSDENIVEEINSSEVYNQEQFKILEKKISELEIKNNELNIIINEDKANSKNLLSETKIYNDKLESFSEINNSKIENKKIEEAKVKKSLTKKNNENKKAKDHVKDIEYTSVDQKGNVFYLLANSGRSNIDNNDILDLISVRGKITSDKRDTIHIVSDFAQYNSVNLNSKFYENVIINYQDKEITCINFDINMKTNKAVAYNDVLITDSKSKMRAGLVEFDLKTKNININPKNTVEDINVVTN